MNEPVQHRDPLHESWTRLEGLLRVYLPGWRVAPADGFSGGRIRRIPVCCGDGEVYADAFEIRAPRSGIGNIPTDLWPHQLCLAVCFRLRMLGWWGELRWPGEIVVDSTPVGWVRWGMNPEHLWCRVEVRLTRNRGSRIPPAALAGAAALDDDSLSLSLVQSVIRVLESPWPPARMLNYYREWCTTLGTKVAGIDPAGAPFEGIAAGVTPNGWLTVERPGGSLVQLPPPMEADFGNR